MAGSISDSYTDSDLLRKPVRYEIEKSYEIFVAKYEKEMHESYRLDIKLQDLNIQLEHKTHRLRAKKSSDKAQKIKILEEKVYLKQIELSETRENVRNLKKQIEKLRLDKLATKSQTKKTTDFLVRTRSEASLHSKKRQKDEFKSGFHQNKIDELAQSISLTIKQRSQSTARFISERTSPLKKRFTIPNVKIKPNQTSAPITRILTKKWRQKTIDMNRKLDDCQKSVCNLRLAMHAICEHENLYSYDQVVLSFIQIYETQNSLQRQLFVLKHECDLYIDTKKLYQEKKSALISSNITKKTVLQGLKNDQAAKLAKLKSREVRSASRLELYSSSIKQAENVISDINSSAFNTYYTPDTKIFEQISRLETGLSELMTFIKLSKKSPYAITGLLFLDFLRPKEEFYYKIGNMDWEAADVEDERPLTLSELHEKTLKVLQYMKKNHREL